MSLFEKLLPEIVAQFKIISPDNIKIVKPVNEGFSGAEVYAVEIYAPAQYTGSFFLKIDRDEAEYTHCKIAERFSFSAKVIDSTIIDDYYVLLTQLAGNSGIDCKAFNQISGSDTPRLVQILIQTLLNESVDKERFSTERMSMSDICSKLLKKKLSDDGAIANLLNNHLSDPRFPTIAIGDRVYPNALYYALTPDDRLQFDYIPVPTHGDFHGENIFFNTKNFSFSVIDWALAEEDGLLFFDTAYFELSQLLRKAENYSIDNWLNIISGISEATPGRVLITGHEQIEAIQSTENQWIEQVNTIKFSHTDKMKLAQSLSRVIAGLNFAGKKKVNDTVREKAFLFSCIFLKRLFHQMSFTPWKDAEVLRWTVLPNTEQQHINESAVNELAEDCANFNGQQYRYILICGSNQSNYVGLSDYLARIPWTGVISLSRKTNEPLYKSIQKSRLLRNLLISQTALDLKNNISHGATWWMFADGVEGDPDTIFDGFAKWRNKTFHFLQDTIPAICSATSPQDLKIIIDVDSVCEGEKEKLKRIIETFDIDEVTVKEMAQLGTGSTSFAETVELTSIQARDYNVGMAGLATYAARYLGPANRKGIQLPHVDKLTGVQMNEEDRQFVSAYIEIVGDHLLNAATTPDSKHSFYWGEPISWDAIEEGLPVNRPEVEKYREMLESNLKSEKWGHIRLGHTPGAGATVLCRCVLWQLKNKYPIVRILQLGRDTFESLRRVATLSGLPLLILMDGDYTLADLELLEANLRSSLIKHVVLYTYRHYQWESGASKEETDQAVDALGIMDNRTAEKFEVRYCNEIQQKKMYIEAEIVRRQESLRSLTLELSLRDFRLPFFYGMYAFKEEFVSIDSFTHEIAARMDRDTDFCKAVSYIAIITCYTENMGLSGKITKKILSRQSHSTTQVLKYLNEELPNFIYVYDNAFRICHPVIAYHLLLNKYGVEQNNKPCLASINFSALCKDFIHDIRRIEGGEEPSDYANNLITDIFITRDFVGSDNTGNESAKNSFSSIILDISVFQNQKDVFQCLVQNFPNNPHGFQHYGRLLINNEPHNLVMAREQFNKAIELDGANPMHYHARGDMYRKYCRNLLNFRYHDSNISPQDIYDGCKDVIDLAIDDFKSTITLALQNNPSTSYNLSYPYSSILNTCAMIISSLQEHYKKKYGKDDFWMQDVAFVQWARTLMADGSHFMLLADSEHDEFQADDYYCAAKEKLVNIRFSDESLRKLIEIRKSDLNLKLIYVWRTNAKKDALKKKSQFDLSQICNYCEDILAGRHEVDEGVLWKWFNVYPLTNTFDCGHAIGVLESLPNKENSVGAMFMLSVFYFCLYIKTGEQTNAEMGLKYSFRCKNLTLINPKRNMPICYLTESNPTRLTTEKLQATKFPCTILEEVTQEQSATMKMDIDQRFKVFFVPYHHPKVVKIGQGFNLKVNAVIGFSFSGLRGFDLELRDNED